MKSGIVGLKNSLWLPKRICQRAGITVKPRPLARRPFGMAAYTLAIPDDFSSQDAKRLVWLIRRTDSFEMRRLRYGFLRELCQRAGWNARVMRHRQR